MVEAMDDQGKVTGHVFISYVREDRDRVDQLEAALTAEDIPVWRDTNDLWPGQDWRENIRRAITDDALVFIACFSRRSLSKDKSYQNEELLLAVEQLRLRQPSDPWLIPVRFDDCHIPDRDLGAGRTLAAHSRQCSVPISSVIDTTSTANGSSSLSSESSDGIRRGPRSRPQRPAGEAVGTEAVGTTALHARTSVIRQRRARTRELRRQHPSRRRCPRRRRARPP